jgi:spore maturation protein CgeB
MYCRRYKILIFQAYGEVIKYKIVDCKEALFDLGHRVEIVDLRKLGSSIGESIKNLRIKLEEFKPHFALSVDHIFTIEEKEFVPQLLTRMRIPHASWLTDNPFYCKWITKRSISPYCCLFVWDEAYIDALRKYGFQNVFHLPLATNPKVFRPLTLGEEERRRFECNLSFCGSSFYPDYRKCILNERNELKRLIFERIIRHQSQHPTKELSQIIKDVQEELGCKIFFEDEMEAKKTLEFASMAFYRLDLLQGVKEFGLTLCGDEGWRYLINEVNFLGWLEYRELPKLYNSAKINLNITLSQIKTTMTIRAFDIPACGGFMLTDYRVGLKDLFNIESEVVYYKDKRDLVDKIKYFLRHPDERKEIARRARKRVVREHTYFERMKSLVNVMKDLFDL